MAQRTSPSSPSPSSQVPNAFWHALQAVLLPLVSWTSQACMLRRMLVSKADEACESSAHMERKGSERPVLAWHD